MTTYKPQLLVRQDLTIYIDPQRPMLVLYFSTGADLPDLANVAA